MTQGGPFQGLTGQLLVFSFSDGKLISEFTINSEFVLPFPPLFFLSFIYFLCSVLIN